MRHLSGKAADGLSSESARQAGDVGSGSPRDRRVPGSAPDGTSRRLGAGLESVATAGWDGDVASPVVCAHAEAPGSLADVSGMENTSPTSCAEGLVDAGLDGQAQLPLPLLGDDAVWRGQDLVLSIRPEYSQKILDGRKTVELRRRFPASVLCPATLYIYATSPVRAMVGCARLQRIHKLPTDMIWSRFGEAASIDRSGFDRYFDGVGSGFALVLDDARKLSRAIPLSEMRERFRFEPPQSFRYTRHDFQNAVMDVSPVVSH